MDDLMKEFLTESNENLARLNQEIVELEKSPENTEILNSIFRTIHTIKGTCGFLGLERLERVAHAGENVLDQARSGRLAMDSNVVTLVLEAVDQITSILEGLEAAGEEPAGDDSELIQRLASLVQGASASAAETAEAREACEARAEAEDTTASREPEPEEKATAPEPKTAEGAHDKVPVSEQSLRVNVEILDSLMNMVGELVLTRNQLLQLTQQEGTHKDGESIYDNSIQHLNRVTSDLQEVVMKTRMQPIGNAWAKLPRLVRDLSQSSGKKIQLVMNGKETELDRQVLQLIQDPLTHIVRNSADHGIEAEEVRVRAGKPAAGTITLNSYHESGHIIIEIQDDGAGIDVDKVRKKAVERGLVTEEAAADLPDAHVLQFIFEAGFSTAEKVTAVSGRGVGMDVVRSNIEKIAGTIDIQSRRGKGTTLKIKIPLTLAIIPALLINSGGDRYAIPQVSLMELVRLEGEQARSGIERVHGVPVYRLRGRLLPLVYLNRELMTKEDGFWPSADGPAEGDAINIVVLQAEDRLFGLVVDEINDTEEIVVKPLGKLLKGVPAFAGATIMGDGKVALILDVLGIAQRSNVVSEARDRSLADQAAPAPGPSKDRRTLLLIGVGPDGRMAIPLSIVSRLEEFPRSLVERAGDQDVVQYREEILPLIRLSSVLPTASADAGEEGDSIKVVVYSDQGRNVGIVVDRILDIVEESISVERRGGGDGLLGSAVIQERVTDLLDVEAIIRTADPTFFDRPVAA